MKVMPSVFGQIGQSVADNLFEIGKSAVKGTVKAVADVASESIEQVTSAPASAAASVPEKSKAPINNDKQETKKRAEMERFNEVKAELAQYIERKQQLDQKIAEEKMEEDQGKNQKKAMEKGKRDSWVSRIINRSQTNTEKGRLQE